MAHDVLLAIAIVAAGAAAVPIVGYPSTRGSRVDPYRNPRARWVVYVGSGIALLLFIVLASGSN